MQRRCAAGIEEQRHQMMEDFVLPRCDTGQAFELRSLKPRRNVVLVLTHGAYCENARAFVGQLVEHSRDFAEQNAAVLILSPNAVEWPAAAPQFVPLCDNYGVVARAYLRAAKETLQSQVAMFIADRWQAVRERAIADEEYELPKVEAVLETLRAIEAECPECAPVSYGWGEEQ